MTFKRTLLSILALSLCLLCPYHIASGETAPLRGGDPELTFVIDRSYSTTTIKLPVLCRNERAQGLCRRLTGYFARRFERELILLSNELINLEEGEFQHVRLHGEQSVYLFFLKNTEAPLTTLYAVSFQYLPNVPERRMVETFNFDREEERNVPFEELFEDPELASMLVARYMEEALVRRAFSPRQKHVERKADSLFRKKDIEQVHIAFAWPSLAREDERLDAASVVNIILGGGMSSRLFQRVREQLGLAYTVYSYLSSFTEGGLLTVYAGVNPANVGRAQEAIMQTVRTLREEKFTKDEFLRGKEQIKSSLILSQENSATQMVAYGKYMLYNDRELDLEGRVEHIASLTMDDCAEALSLHFGEKCAAAAVGKIESPLSV